VAYILGVAEEGGEMVVISFMAWFVYAAFTIQVSRTNDAWIEPHSELIRDWHYDYPIYEKVRDKQPEILSVQGL